MFLPECSDDVQSVRKQVGMNMKKLKAVALSDIHLGEPRAGAGINPREGIESMRGSKRANMR